MAITSVVIDADLIGDVITHLIHKGVDIDPNDPDNVEILGQVLAEFIQSRGQMSFNHSSYYSLFTYPEICGYQWVVDYWMEDVYATYEPIFENIMNYHAVHLVTPAIWNARGTWTVGAILFHH